MFPTIFHLLSYLNLSLASCHSIIKVSPYFWIWPNYFDLRWFNWALQSICFVSLFIDAVLQSISFLAAISLVITIDLNQHYSYVFYSFWLFYQWFQFVYLNLMYFILLLYKYPSLSFENLFKRVIIYVLNAIFKYWWILFPTVSLITLLQAWKYFSIIPLFKLLAFSSIESNLQCVLLDYLFKSNVILVVWQVNQVFIHIFFSVFSTTFFATSISLPNPVFSFQYFAVHPFIGLIPSPSFPLEVQK
jgi:hypothetical protein